MSIELHVIFRGEPPNKPALQHELKRLEFPFSLKPATGSLEKQSGYMPMAFRGDDTGVELSLSHDRESIEDLLGGSADPPFERIASFRWGGDETEMAAGYCVAAALANLTNGIVLDDETGELLSPVEALQAAKLNFSVVANTPPTKRHRSRPDDIKE